jgi:hypothetical protein
MTLVSQLDHMLDAGGRTRFRYFFEAGMTIVWVNGERTHSKFLLRSQSFYQRTALVLYHYLYWHVPTGCTDKPFNRSQPSWSCFSHLHVALSQRPNSIGDNCCQSLLSPHISPVSAMASQVLPWLRYASAPGPAAQLWSPQRVKNTPAVANLTGLATKGLSSAILVTRASRRPRDETDEIYGLKLRFGIPVRECREGYC